MLSAPSDPAWKPTLHRWSPFLAAAGSIAAIILLTDFVHFFVYRRSYVSEYVLSANLPLKLAAIQVWALGELPTWHSGLASGWPALADASTMPFDWRNLFYFVFDPVFAYWLALFVSRLLGALLLFYYFRLQHGIGVAAALPATFVYFCGTLIIEDSRAAGGVVWDLLPGYLWVVERLYQRMTPNRIAALAAYCLLMYTMGSFSFLIYVGPMAGLWAFGLFVADRNRDWRRFALFTGLFFVAHGLGLSLTGVALLPFIEFVLHSNRGGEYGSDPFALRSLFFALFGPHDQYNPHFPSFGFLLYVGVLSVPLLLTVWMHPKTVHERAVLLLSLVSIGTLLVLATPLKVVLAEFIPAVSTLTALRVAPFWGFIAALGVACALNRSEWLPGMAVRVLIWIMLALQVGALSFVVLLALVWGIAWLESPGTLANLQHLGAFLTAGFLVLVAVRALCLFSALTPGGPGRLRLLGALLVAELTLAMAIARPSTEVQTYYPETPELRFLKANLTPEYRVMMMAPAFMHKTWDAYTTLLFDAVVVHRLNSASIYHSLIIKEYADLFENFGDLEERKALGARGVNQAMWTHRAASPLMDAMAVRYLISALPVRDPVNDVTRLTERVKGENYIIYERPDPMPRAFFVSAGQLLDRQAIHDRLRSIARGQFTQQQLRRYVLLDNSTVPQSGIPPALMRNDRAEAFVPARIERDKHTRISLSVTAPSAGWLVLSDAYYPGWVATVDGQTVPIIRANGFARAVPIPAGAHQIEFRFRPGSVRYGALLSLGAALATLALVFAPALLARRRRSSEPTTEKS